MTLHGRVALVTGGTRGIGEAIAQRFAREGARVAICGRDPHDVARAGDTLKRAGAEIVTGVLDISERGQVAAFVERILSAWDRVDILVNNAAIQGPIGRIDGNDPVAWFDVLRINILGTFLVTHAVIPSMIRHGRGKIMNLAGGGATSARPNFSAYAASKAAVVRLTETIAEELREHRIDVNAIAPGAVNTRMLDEVLHAGESAGNEIEDARRRARDGGTSPDVAADLAAFLASDESDGITGKLISAPWDPWQDSAFRLRLREDKDLATLRRIDDKHFGPLR